MRRVFLFSLVWRTLLSTRSSLAMLFLGICTTWGASGVPRFLFLRIFSVSTHPHGSLTIFGVLYWGMPLDNTYFWLRAITPTTHLNNHHDKQQNEAYHVSWHKMFLLFVIQASLCRSPSLSLPYP